MAATVIERRGTVGLTASELARRLEVPVEHVVTLLLEDSDRGVVACDGEGRWRLADGAAQRFGSLLRELPEELQPRSAPSARRR